MTSTYYLKFTNRGRVPKYQGGDPLKARVWLPEVKDPVLCERGWHACRWEDTVHHIGPELWIVEMRGTIVAGTDKVVASEQRLVKRVTAWDRPATIEFACRCAEKVLSVWEARYPSDDRPRKAIEAARSGDRVLAAAAYAAGTAAGTAAAAATYAATHAANAAANAAGTAAAATYAANAATYAYAAANAAATANAANAARADVCIEQANTLGELCGLNPADFAHQPAKETAA